MRYFFLAMFIVVTTIHLWASLKKDAKIRGISKPFILLSLIGFYVSAADDVSVAIVLALAFSWLGDVLLMAPGVNWFVVGGISFMISHLCFITGYCRDITFSKIPIVLMVLLPLIYAVIVSNVFGRLKKYLDKVLIYPMFLYLFLNGAMNCFSVYRCVSNFSAATLITAIGALLFFISDTTLFFVRFKKDSVFKTHFVVMLTYSLGEFLIVLGLI